MFEIAIIYFDNGIYLLIILAVLQEELDLYRENWIILNHIIVSVFLKQTFKKINFKKSVYICTFISTAKNNNNTATTACTVVGFKWFQRKEFFVT